MRFAMFRRSQAKKVTAVAGVPVHGLERDADGVMLHLGVDGEKPLVLFVPAEMAGEMEDYLRRVTDALKHWRELERRARIVRVHPVYRTNERGAEPIPEVDFRANFWSSLLPTSWL